MVHFKIASVARLSATLLFASISLHAASPPRRIISTAPGITEMLFALGLGDRVIGVTQYCRYPKEVEKIPRIGSWTTPNLEEILASKPDLIIVQRTAMHDSAKFNSVGLKTLEVKIDRIADILRALEVIGTAAGIEDHAKALSASLRKQLQQVYSRVQARPATSVLFVVGRNPGSLEGIVAAAGNSYLSEVIAAAGGRNIFADSSLGYAKISPEEILARKPEVIIDMGEHPEGTGISERQRRAEVALWGRFPSIPAVKNGRIHIVASEIFVVPGPRVVELARILASILHPELSR